MSEEATATLEIADDLKKIGDSNRRTYPEASEGSQ